MNTKVTQYIYFQTFNGNKVYRVGNKLFKNVSYTENLSEATDYSKTNWFMKHLFVWHFRSFILSFCGKK